MVIRHYLHAKDILILQPFGNEANIDFITIH
jgi:hypothetical protein